MTRETNFNEFSFINLSKGLLIMRLMIILSHFWSTCYVAKVHEVCSLDLYAKYFFRFVIAPSYWKPMWQFKVYPSIWWVVLECTHPFKRLYRQFEKQKIDKRNVWGGWDRRGGIWHNHVYLLRNAEVSLEIILFLGT